MNHVELGEVSFVVMSYTELEHGYQGLQKARPSFYLGSESHSSIRSSDKRVRTFLYNNLKVLLLPTNLSHLIQNYFQLSCPCLNFLFLISI